ncbi:MAG: glutathione S-transferase family protein [Alphaproteobacteria bacterium]|nr:glutathione S-transferase family protein [Alphaproteobacteria bacterium]
MAAKRKAKAAAKKAAKRAVKKVAARKPVARKAAARRAAPAKKAVAKRAPARKVAAKKPAAKKPPARKPAGKKIVGKIQIFGPVKSRARRTYWAVQELGLPHERVELDMAAGAHKRPDYLAINPNAKVPAMKHGDLTLFESMAINLYLAKLKGGPLAPQGPKEEARTLQWTLWGVAEVEPLLMTIGYNRMFLSEAERKEDRAQDAERKLPGPLGVLDKVLGEKPWLVGGRFTIADLNLASIVSFAKLLKLDLSRWPHVADWLDRCIARPGAKVG